MGRGGSAFGVASHQAWGVMGRTVTNVLEMTLIADLILTRSNVTVAGHVQLEPVHMMLLAASLCLTAGSLTSANPTASGCRHALHQETWLRLANCRFTPLRLADDLDGLPR